MGVEETMSAVTFSGEYEGGGTFEFQLWAVAEPEQPDPGNGEPEQQDPEQQDQGNGE